MIENKLPTLDMLPNVRLGAGYVDLEKELPIMHQFSPLILIFALLIVYKGELDNHELIDILGQYCNDKK